MGEGRSSGGNLCRWRCPRPPKGPASWVLSSVSCGPGDGGTEMEGGLPQVLWAWAVPTRTKLGKFAGQILGGDLCSFLGLSFHISKMGAK